MRIISALIIVFFSISTIAQSNFRLQKVDSFFPDWKELESENIDWYYLTVPENYDRPDGRKIKLAVSLLHATSKAADNYVLFIQGGPGGSTISGLSEWLKHPLRKKNDIVLIDLRGTGFSEPRMCPDLGKKFLEVMSKDLDAEEEDLSKNKLAIDCQQAILDEGIDINSYNSKSVSKDLNTLKNELKVNKWNIYSVSYGTFLGQEYAKNYPDDIKSLILDSPIADILDYYPQNTLNYNNSLKKLFQQCKDDPKCNKSFPKLDEIYSAVSKDLKNNPLTVKVDKNIIYSEKFTFNVEDFKIAIHQSLYQEEVIEVLPLLIYEFHHRNKEVLSTFVSALSGKFSLDYGTYYCFTCDEAIKKDFTGKFTDHLIDNGLSFYVSDMKICSTWNKKGIKNNDISKYSRSNRYPVLILSGEFDPITPPKYGIQVAKNYNNCSIIFAKTYGHSPGSSKSGKNILANFIDQTKNLDSLKFHEKNIKFITNVYLNNGIFYLASDLNRFDWLFFTPMLVGIFIMITFLFYFFFEFRINKYSILNYLIFASIILGFVSLGLLYFFIYRTAEINFYILSFGILSEYSFVLVILRLFTITSVISLAYFILFCKKISKNQYYVLVMFSLLVLNIYIYYWNL